MEKLANLSILRIIIQGWVQFLFLSDDLCPSRFTCTIDDIYAFALGRNRANVTRRVREQKWDTERDNLIQSPLQQLGDVYSGRAVNQLVRAD